MDTICKRAGESCVPRTRRGAWAWRAMAASFATVLGVFPVHAGIVSPRRLLETVDLADPVVSPDGNNVAFRTEQAAIERNTYDTIWYVQALDGGALPHRVADGGIPLRDSAGTPLPAVATWSPDGRWIYYRARVEGKIGVWRAATDGSGAFPVTRDDADVRRFALSADGRTLTYSAGATRAEVRQAEQDEYGRGIRIDGHVPIGQPLFRSGFVEGRLATQRFGNVWFDRQSLLADVPDRWTTVDVATGQHRASAAVDSEPAQLQAEDAAKAEARVLQVVRDVSGKRVAVLTRVADKQGIRNRPETELSVRRDLGDGTPIRCDAAPCRGKEISGIRWRPTSDEVLFTVTDIDKGLAQSIFRWNVDTGEVQPLVTSRGLLGGGREPSNTCGVSPRMLVCVTAEADVPPRLEKIDLRTGERKVLFEPNAALAHDIAKVAPAVLLRWKDAKGRQFTGQFFNARRPGSPPAPLFVTYYSCPGFLRGGLGDEWPLVSLAEQGISALCINRLSGYTLDAVERHAQGARAVESVIALLASEGEVDRSAVGMGGLSYGGAVTMWTATNTPSLAAASISSSVVSPLYYLIGSLKGDTFTKGLLELWGLGAPAATPEQWRKLSPVFKRDRITAPLLFQMSEQEYIDSLDYLIPMLREHRAELYVFPNEPHQKFQPQHKLAVYNRNLDWFRFWLQRYEDPDPSKREQYERWRRMAGTGGGR